MIAAPGVSHLKLSLKESEPGQCAVGGRGHNGESTDFLRAEQIARADRLELGASRDRLCAGCSAMAFGSTCMNPKEIEHLGEPDLQIAGLRVWVHGREFPNAMDYWDGNFLRVTVYCTYPESMVRVHGSLIHLREIVALLRSCEKLYQTLEGRAALECIEPNLGVELLARTGGHIHVTISITPDHMSQEHRFDDSFDQTFLPPIIAACRRILERFPVRQAERLPA
jgi:hypothetical protein